MEIAVSYYSDTVKKEMEKYLNKVIQGESLIANMEQDEEDHPPEE